jgi:hypothetical protein
MMLKINELNVLQEWRSSRPYRIELKETMDKALALPYHSFPFGCGTVAHQSNSRLRQLTELTGILTNLLVVVFGHISPITNIRLNSKNWKSRMNLVNEPGRITAGQEETLNTVGASFIEF